MSEEIYISEEARQHEIDIFANDELALGERTQLLLNQQIQMACLNWRHRDAVLQTKIAALEAEVVELRKDKVEMSADIGFLEGVLEGMLIWDLPKSLKKRIAEILARNTALNSTKGEK